MRNGACPRADPRSWKGTESVLLAPVGFGALWKGRGRAGAPGRGRLWGQWNRWREPRGVKGWNRGQAECFYFLFFLFYFYYFFISIIPEKNNLQEGWGWSLAGGRQGMEQ